jgi:hypothetical protein
MAQIKCDGSVSSVQSVSKNCDGATDPRESAFIRVPFAMAENSIAPRDTSIMPSGKTETAARGRRSGRTRIEN